MEIIDIFNNKMELVGKEERNIAHSKGYWHKTFHCWIIINDGNEKRLLFQKRSPNKKTNPNKFSISAGHLLSGEIVEEGVREIKEELGVDVDFKDLKFLGIYKKSLKNNELIDNEFCYVYLYETDIPIFDFDIDLNESIGLFDINLNDFQTFINGGVSFIEAVGFLNTIYGMNKQVKNLTIDDFSYLGDGYYKWSLEKIKEHVK